MAGAEVLITLRAMPEDERTNLEDLAEKLKKVASGRFNHIEEKPIGFGIVALEAHFVVPEEEGASSRLEDEVKALEGVGEVEVVESSRLL